MAGVATRTTVVQATGAILAGPIASGAAATIRPVERPMAAVVSRAREAHGLPGCRSLAA